MYAEYFGLREKPFSITPDPAYVYMSPAHEEALGHLLYGTGEAGGFVQLTGEVGTGKTTLIRTLLKQDIPDVDVALVLNPRVTAVEFMQSLLDELHVDYPREATTLKPLVDALNERLLQAHAQGRHTVLIIDEAQNLSRDLLEQVRLLTNLETHRDKLLRIMLIGQPELREMLMRQDLRQLAQRITARCHLDTLDRAQTAAYVSHRVQVAGGHPDLFSRAALAAVYRSTGGVPRLINIVCDRALLGAYSQNLRHVDRRTLRKAAREVLQGTRFRRLDGRFYPWAWAGAVLLAALIGVAVYQGYDAVASSAPEPALASAQPAADDPAADDVGQADAENPKLPITHFANQQAAVAALAGLWSASLPAGSLAGCAALAAEQLQCKTGTGGWTQLAQFNLPVALQLNSGWVVLKQMQGSAITLVTPEGERSSSTGALETQWGGHYLLLWQPQVGAASIGSAADAQAIGWLDAHLRLSEGRLAQQYPQPSSYSWQLRERVKRFQRKHKLAADGLAGPRTLFALQQLQPPASSPQLQPEGH